MKKFAKIFMIVACMAMVFCFTAGVSATETDENDVTVTINVQELARAYDSDNDGILDARHSTPIASNTATKTISSVETTATLYDVIVAAGLANAYGTAPSCWDLVDIYAYNPETDQYEDTGDDAYALTRINYNNGYKENNGSYPFEGQNFYQGSSWMWYEGSTLPQSGTWGAMANYPTKYLSQVTVGELANYNYTFTLSFETDFMTW